uniref:Putative tetracycline transporter protein n=1 Tax=Arabidopsis thaliana TaxID=3702 RepID=O22994_ARATH|nr:putative tetracycline transporter protein [Arabidopsis thaliana]
MEVFRLGELRHLLVTVFLSGLAEYLIRPVMTDVTVAAVCSGLDDSCSLAVYLTGVQQVTVGMGTMVMMPVIGNLSDRYGIKAMLTLPMCLSVLPPAILGYRRDTNFFYAFYVIKTLFDMAKNVHGTKRISMFGILAGVSSISGVCASLSARFLSIASTFQVAAISLFIGLVYMRVFLKERLQDADDDDEADSGGCRSHQEVHNGGDLKMLTEPILRDAPTKTHVFNSKYSSWKDMYFLKARFGFNKNDFAELFLLVTIIGSISQLFILPTLSSTIGERKVLSTGLLMEFFNATCLSVAWSPWVPYAMTMLVPGAMFVMPSVCGIASRQVGSSEQGKVQGCISGVRAFAQVVAPFVYSPLTALFLSENAPFYFPGFSILCIAISLMIGFLQSLLIKDHPSLPLVNITINNPSKAEA